MTTFDRHLLREWLGILALMLVLMCGLLLVQVMYDDFRDLREAGARGGDLAWYIVVTMPSFLSVALPLVLLVSTLFVLGKLHRANEFTAMRAAGVGFGRLMAPLWVVGFLSCGLSWWLNATVVPWSVAQSRELHESIEFKREARSLSPDRIGAVYDVGFYNPQARRMWFFNRFSKFTRKGYGVSVTELDEGLRETRGLEATEASYDPVRKGWVFTGGRQMQFEADLSDPDSRTVVRPLPFRTRFEGGFQEDPDLMLLIGQRPIDLSFFELKRLVDYFSGQPGTKGVPYALRYYSLLADTLGPLMVIAISIPFAVAGVRVNPAVGVSKSILLLFLYYLLLNVAAALAANGAVGPAAAAWLPDLSMGAIAGWLFLRLR